MDRVPTPEPQALQQARQGCLADCKTTSRLHTVHVIWNAEIDGGHSAHLVIVENFNNSNPGLPLAPFGWERHVGPGGAVVGIDFASKARASAHPEAGARKALVSAPDDNADLTNEWGFSNRMSDTAAVLAAA